MALGDVPGDGQHAVGAFDRQRPGGEFTQADLPIAAPDMTTEVTHETVALQLLDQALALVEIDPDTQVGEVWSMAGLMS